MWIIKKFDDPGINYGRYQVGYFEMIAQDSIFRGIGGLYDQFELNDAEVRIGRLNGGLQSWIIDSICEGLDEITAELHGIKKELERIL
jgi:hypothetical protein